MHELASVHQHENGYSVLLRKPKSETKKGDGYAYDAGTSHVAEDHNKATALVHAHLAGIADNQAKASKDKADRMGNAARKAYRALVDSDAEGKQNRKDAHRENTLRKGSSDAYEDAGQRKNVGTRDEQDALTEGQ